MAKAADTSRFLTVRQVADELDVTVSAVYGLIYRGTLRAMKRGRSRRVGVEDRQAYRAGMKERGLASPPRLLVRPGQRPVA